MNCSSVRSGGTWLFSIPIRAAITFLPIDLRLAPTGRQTFLRHERQNDFAAPGGLLQRFLPALAGRNAALGVEIEEDVLPAVLCEPVADLDGLVVVEARMTDEKARHRPCRQSSDDLESHKKSCAGFVFRAS